ncbi:HLH domain containing protein [Pyrenophora tritici-repentis]|uniref:HLH, helix-loop-helix DNA-binding protein n=2 Tax=Pyrenophora tritici-repentis TaxID=45151 RepID=A0A2W1DEH8_9PLEO|nr:uncharacterized protein PTRG_06022 [Pyrenophora tritici-repentis Pt-1C-BFP]KAA8619156.1 HLH helix-loop-helix DNA-binding protein [Pyrenophora tritici-repentis]EDU48942.1 predicted protein [Pyrenophora tritici-repentis Pt-1C-BFP]KAF7449627.1 HLH helix-loop-helix DNA-binding protein [Pyrenophora tritici-repentis]KAF7570252.1 HLH, helix-loop-helix DNA-binding protein [Pyrenophora tritici-repentis]KAG9383440.1 HLH helix-loop-helix DNA-binding protein [Pyrenophora tritici-repentis]
MNDKDPPPFGYTFSNDFFESIPSACDNNGQSILSDMENQHLDNFFSSTNPFDLLDSQPLPPALESKASAHDYNNWEDFIAPPTVHRVTSTIPDQARLQNNFHHDPHYAPSLHSNFLANTEDELQAAATLFNQAQPSYINGRSHSMHEQPHASTNFAVNCTSDFSHTGLSMTIPPHSLMNERLGVLTPSHNGQGMDPQFPPQWSTSKAPQQQQADFGPPLQKLDLKRSYTFGTDNSFNSPSGFSGLNGRPSSQVAARSSINDVEETHQHLLRAVAGIVEAPSTSPTTYTHTASSLAPGPRDDDDQSEEDVSNDEHDDRPAKKRKKSLAKGGKDTPKKAARSSKARKAVVAEESAKKKRTPAAAQKTHRENLTEEQKRNNHILSEQKRRDLIKQGYKDLNEVVPAVRGGGLSKSQVLVEAANFLEKLIEDNETYRRSAG